MTLLGSNAKMVCRFFEIAMLVKLNGFCNMIFRREALIAAGRTSSLWSNGAL
jgi:hypothetical protein